MTASEFARTETGFECLLTRLNDSYVFKKLWVLLLNGCSLFTKVKTDIQKNIEMPVGKFRQTLKGGCVVHFGHSESE